MKTPTPPHRSLRAAAAGLLAGLSLLLTGCFITPGKFTSELVLGPDQEFAYTYDGEIFFLGLSQLAEMGESAEEFTPEPCYVDGTFNERECTRNELEGQRAEWEAGAEKRAEEAKEKAEQMSVLLGGVDASDPEASAEFIRILMRQKGWNKVEDKGNGVFDVSYSLTGKLTHDFMFPVIEGVPSTNPFVQVLLRDDNVVRVNAPGFSPQNEDNPMGGLMGGMGALAGLAAMSPDVQQGDQPAPELPVIDGTFTITMAPGMGIRANNTDEGASAVEGGQQLKWKIDARTKSAPTALISLGE